VGLSGAPSLLPAREIRRVNVVFCADDGMTALDFGLSLVELLTDAGTRAAVADQMDYPYGRDVSIA